MAMPTRFRTASQPIASYDYTDIDEGTGVVVFYGFTHKEESTESFALSQRATYSYTIVHSKSVSTTDATKAYDHDYDLSPFNTPKTIKGTARVMVTFGGQAKPDSARSIYFIAKLRKWDGTTETEIASAQSATESLTYESSPDTDSFMQNVEITIPRTHFASGETLRLTFELWSTGGGPVHTNTIGYAHDPKNREDTNSTKVIETSHSTIMEVHIPFLLDL